MAQVIDPAATWTPPDDAALTALLAREWGLHGTLSPLPSYMDHNRRVRCAEGDFVLKIAHPQWCAEALDFENSALLHLARSGCPARTPRLQPCRQGASMRALPLGDGRVAHARVIDFIDGDLLADVAMNAGLARSIGEQVAWLASGLSDYRHPAEQLTKEWDLASLPSLRGEIENIDDSVLRSRVAIHVDAFAARLPKWRKFLPQQVIHNDANDYNIIVERGGNGVRAIIDFGDMCRSFRLSDLAVACVYAIQRQADPQALIRELVAGYESILPLLDEERTALPHFIRARLCLSILMATRAHRADPGNGYILVSQTAVRALLLRLG